ncbi:MAG: c-type cytochrome [Kiritimatiellia bacterium]
MIKFHHNMNRLTRLAALAALPWAFLLATGCELRQAMYDQPKYTSLQESNFFTNRMASRPLVEGTVARGFLQDDNHLYEGRIDGMMVDSFPFEITTEVMNRGQERYNIFCSPCHGYDGNGYGMIIRRGFKQPTSFHDQRLVDSPEGYFYNVIKNGYGVMMNYAAQIPVEDRWAIIAYIRALQFGQRASLDDVPENFRAELEVGH